MTTQSPDEIAIELIAINFSTTKEHAKKDYPILIASISQAIYQERASKPTLVLPKFDDLFIAVNESKKAESEAKYLYHWLHAEIARLNAPTVCEENK